MEKDKVSGSSEEVAKQYQRQRSEHIIFINYIVYNIGYGRKI